MKLKDNWKLLNVMQQIEDVGNMSRHNDILYFSDQEFTDIIESDILFHSIFTDL